MCTTDKATKNHGGTRPWNRNPWDVRARKDHRIGTAPPGEVMSKRPEVRRRQAQDPHPPEPAAPPADAPTGAPRSPRVTRRATPPPPTKDAPEVMAADDRLSDLEALASGATNMADLLGDVRSPKLPDPGDRVEGVVSRVSGDEVQVDLGLKSEAWLSLSELRERPEVGDTLSAWVVSAGDMGVRLSLRLSGEAAASMLEDAVDSGVPVQGKITGHNAGGYEVRLGDVRAFCPHSQIDRVPVSDPAEMVGRELSFRVIEADDKVVVSRRALQEAEIEAGRDARLASLQEGDVVDAVVLRVLSWGAFLDTDGVELLLPRREYGWEEIEDLSAALARGQRLKVRIARIDHDEGRIIASSRDPGLDPWNEVGSRFRVGSLVSGKVVSQVDFGVFVELAEGLQGLLHSSQLGNSRPAPGTTITVRVDAVDAERRRLSLALPGTDGDQAEAAEALAHHSAQANASLGTLGDLFAKLKR